MSWPLLRYVLTAAIRDRLIICLLLLLMIGTSLAVFMGTAAFSEKAKFVVVFASGGLRIASVTGLVLFVVFYVRRSFESRDVEFLLSRPIGRVQFLLSFAAAFSIMAALLALVVGVAVSAFHPPGGIKADILWTASLIAESIIMVNTALFFAMVLNSSAVAAMVSFAFYVLARMMGQILGILDAGFSLDTIKMKYHSLDYIMQGISMLMPRLDLLGQTSWLLYGPDHTATDLFFIMLQGLTFSALILLAALVDLLRRQF